MHALTHEDTSQPSAITALLARLSHDTEDPARRHAALSLIVARFLKKTDAQMSRADIQKLVQDLSADGVPLGENPEMSAAINHLASQGFITFFASDRRFILQPLPHLFNMNAPPAPAHQPLKLCRFTSIQLTDGAITASNPMSDRWITLEHGEDAGLVMRFSEPLAANRFGEDDQSLIRALASGGLLLPCDAKGLTESDRDPVRQMWEPHDLALHSTSRSGRSIKPPGGDYPFVDRFDKADIQTPMPVPTHWVALPTPDTPAGANDPGLFAVMGARRSVRQFTEAGPQVEQLAALLHHTLGEKAPGWRKYPNGGALYEQRFFLAIGAAEGIDAGFYLYDPARHALGSLDAAEADWRALLGDAARAMGQDTAPPVLIMIASEFAKVRWKYSGLSYALQLKHAGVIQHALYVAATSLGLGGCALGTGNSVLFAKATGLDHLRVGPIGEFVLGIPRED